MKTQVSELADNRVRLDVEVPAGDVDHAFEHALSDLSQTVRVPGFRKGKAPRFIVENYFGRAALIEEAYEDLVNRSFREALEQEQIEPVGKASLGDVEFDNEPFRFRVTIPIAPTITLPDYAAIHVPLEPSTITDEQVEQAMAERRERHVVLREPEEPRPAQQGDQLTVQIESSVDGEALEQRPEGQDIPESDLIMEPDRLVPGLFDGLVGIQPDETREVTVHMPEDHANEQVRGKDVVFKVTVKRVQERLLPDWDELPVLEEFEGPLDELRAKTRSDLEENARKEAERAVVDEYVKRLIEQTEFDIPDAMIEHEALHLLEEQGRQFERYGISLDQMLQYRGKTREEAAEEFYPQGEERLKNQLVLAEVVRQEGLTVDNAAVDAEIERIVASYPEEERERSLAVLSTQLRSNVASSVLSQKLQERLLQIATSATPAAESAPAEQDATLEPAATEPQE